jgi:hypothetical protein
MRNYKQGGVQFTDIDHIGEHLCTGCVQEENRREVERRCSSQACMCIGCARAESRSLHWVADHHSNMELIYFNKRGYPVYISWCGLKQI